MVVTCVAILAVDFPVFPRRFAKVEDWGTSLMDMGVGSFVFSAGLVSARPVLQARLFRKTSSLGLSLRSAFKTSLPLLILGFVRLYSVKSLDYAEHVTEYGVHWNFFFTLALLPPFVAILQPVSTLIPSTALLSLVLASTYQVALNFTGLQAYILTAPRKDILSLNREGIFSFWGYLAIFLSGQAIGFDIFYRDPDKKPTPASTLLNQRKHLLWRLTIMSTIWMATFISTTSSKYGLDLSVSRRLANLPYVLWVSAFNYCQVTAYCIVETVCFPGVYSATDRYLEGKEISKATSRLLKGFNRNGLVIFLIANLLTGLVNMTMDTLNMGSTGAMSVLVGYGATLTTIALILDFRDVSIKL